MDISPRIIYTTYGDTQIYVQKGDKVYFDFKVQYRERRESLRTPKHIHLIIALYEKGWRQRPNDAIC